MQAPRDNNNIPSILAVLSTDGATVTPVQINPANHALAVDNNTTGADNGPTRALRDENFVTTLMAVSADDGETLVPLYVDADGKLLIDET